MAANRCPLCHRANDGTASQCGKCGYEFGQTVDKAIEIVRDAQRNARIELAVMLVIDAGLIALLVSGFALWGWLAIGAAVFAGLWSVRAGQKVARLAASMRSLKGSKLPQARLLSG